MKLTTFKEERIALALKLIGENELDKASRIISHVASVEEKYSYKGDSFELPKNEISEMWHSYKKPFKSYYYNPSSGITI